VPEEDHLMAVRTVMDDVLERSVSTGQIPGVVAMAADDAGVVYEGAFGKRQLDGDVDMTFDTVFPIASMTKAVTSVAALQLVEKGKLSLDEPIGQVMPALRTPQHFDGWSADGSPTFRLARRTITLRHLLSHTGGFAYPNWNPDMKRYAEYLAQAGPAGETLVPRDALMMYEPGDRWEYGTNTDWVGRAVEAASGQNLETYMQEQIFVPLDMRDTSFVLDADRRARLTSRYQRTGPTTFDVIVFDPPERPDAFNGGGGLFSVGRDYLTFLRALLAGGTLDGVQILGAESIPLLYANQVGDLEAGILPTSIPEISNTANFFPDMVKKWSLAGLINPEATSTGRSAGSMAWGGLFNTYFLIDPTARVTGLILTQILPFADHDVVDVFGQFERAVYDSVAA
jgi:methyl acetate hydrolase